MGVLISLIMITLNHLALQNETRKLVLEINSMTKPEIPTFDEKDGEENILPIIWAL